MDEKPKSPPCVSDNIQGTDKIAQALCQAQGQMDEAELTGRNDFIGSQYADLTSVMKVAREPLHENGLAITQTFQVLEGKTYIVTTLLHTSGQCIQSFLPLLNVTDHHSLGSATTYGRRYSLASMLGICPQGDDDDGETAMGRGKHSNAPARKPATTRKSSAKKAPATRKKAKGKQADLPADPKEKCLAIIALVAGADPYLRGKGIDPGDPPLNIRAKINELGVEGFSEKIKQAREEEVEEIIEDAEKVKPIEDKGGKS